jgi:hypothetical protein
MGEFKCYFCQDDADRIAYFSKFYPGSTKDTIENPLFSCDKCYLKPDMMKKLNFIRGGMSGVTCLKFKNLGGMTEKRIAYYLSKKFFEINHLSNPYWRKILFRIHFLNLPKEKKVA